MKRHIYILIGIVILSGCNNAPKTDSKTSNELKAKVETFIIDLNADNSEDTIILSEPQTEILPGLFRKIQIKGRNLCEYELTANDYWDSIPKELSTKKDNELRTEKLYLKRFNGTSYIILTGYVYPSSGQGDFAILAVNNSKVNLLTKENFQDIPEITDLNNDGQLDIVLNPKWSEVLRDIDSLSYTLTYAPEYVYTLFPNSLKLDTSLTRIYNQKNYVWAGIDTIGKVTVLFNRNEKKYSIYKK